jgi:hypothetical protein
MNRFKGRLPIIGFARGDWPPPGTAIPLLRHAVAGPNVWLVTAGFQPAAADNIAERWLAFNAFKASDDWLPDEVRLVHYGAGQPVVTRSGSATLNHNLRLVEIKTVESLRPGQVLPVELAWQPLAVPLNNYNLFLQLLAADGTLAAQHDGPPNGGYTATTTWTANQPIHSRSGLATVPALAAGSYRLIAGMYDPATGDRLPVDQNGDFVELGQVIVNGQP